VCGPAAGSRSTGASQAGQARLPPARRVVRVDRRISRDPATSEAGSRRAGSVPSKPRCRATPSSLGARALGTPMGMSQQPSQQQDPPGLTSEMTPKPDHGEESYRGSGRMEGRRTIITGGDSGIGRAVAIAFAREGADVLFTYLPEEEPDAEETARWVREAGRDAVPVAGDLTDPAFCRSVVQQAVDRWGRVDVLVSNAAYQMTRETVEEIPDEEWDHTLATNLSAMFHLVKAAVPHMPSGGSIIGSSSVNSDMPKPTLMPYAATKAAIANMCASLAQMLGERGIRVNSVAPGPVWTPLIPSTMPPEQVESFGEQVPLARAGQPVELAPVYVLLASDDGSYVSGARVAVTGGNPIL
jgi:NAD(P)-dependent dehydrogenase (short-subunit alcohol dehydrogenase family)